MIAKTCSRSRVKKGPARDEKHLAKVRKHGCIGWEASIRPLHTNSIVHAHHVRCIGPRTMGKRVSDYLTVPLCAGCHANLHEVNEADFWRLRRIKPAEWIAQFSPEGAAEIARLIQAPDTRSKGNPTPSEGTGT